MKNTILYSFLFLLIITACKKENKHKTVAERISKVWRAKTVKQDASIVYLEGDPNNAIPGYTNFRLDLQDKEAVILKEFNGDVFTGKWQVPNDNLLKLINITPQPTGTNGTIGFTITSIKDTELILTRTSTSVKTGNTINEYTLIP